MRCKHIRVAVLDGQVDEVADVRPLAVDVQQLVRAVLGMARRVADTQVLVDEADPMHEFREVDGLTVRPEAV
jgi:hypothetical protein